MQGGVAVEDGVLAAGHHAAVVPPVTDTVRDGQVRQQGAVLDFVEDGFAEGLLVCGDSFGVFGFCLEVVEDLFAFLVAEPFVGVDEDVAVVSRRCSTFFGTGGVRFCSAMLPPLSLSYGFVNGVCRLRPRSCAAGWR